MPPVFERIEAREIDTLRKMACDRSHGTPTTNAQLVLFDDPGSYAYLAPGGRVVVLSDATPSKLHDDPSDRDAESLLTKVATDLTPGDLLAMPLSADRDLLDELADRYLDDATASRRRASLWREAVRQMISQSATNLRAFAERLKEAGESRDPATIRSWLANGQTVAPRGYRRVIPLIAKITGDHQLSRSLDDVIASIDAVYRARDKAARALLVEIFSGSLDLNQDELTFHVHGAAVRYALRRVRQLGPIEPVPTDLVGRPLTLKPGTPLRETA
jgi:hypothetical protein